MRDVPQIAYEWRDGNVVKAADQSAARALMGHKFTGSTSPGLGTAVFTVATIIASVLVACAILSRRRRSTMMAALISLSLANATLCQCAEHARHETDERASSLRMRNGPYCGIYSLTAVASALGAHIPLAELTSARYVGSELGSSAAQLVEAARNRALSADFVQGLSEWELRASTCPLVLRVSTAERRDVFNHWVAYLGEEAGQARILDYPDPVTLYPFGELLSRWDGSAVVVSRGGAAADRLVWNSRIRVVIGVFAAAIAVVGLGRIARCASQMAAPLMPMGRWRLRLDVVAIVTAALVLAAGVDMLRAGGAAAKCPDCQGSRSCPRCGDFANTNSGRAS